MLVRWTSTVLWVTKSACAISRLVGPSAAISATRRSLGVSDSTPLRAPARAHARSSRSARAARGVAPQIVASSSRLPKLLAGVRAAVGPAKRGAQLGPGLRVLEPGRRPAQDVDRFHEELEPALALDQARRTQGGAERPRGTPRARELDFLGKRAGLVPPAELKQSQRGGRAPRDEGGVPAADLLEQASGLEHLLEAPGQVSAQQRAGAWRCRRGRAGACCGEELRRARRGRERPRLRRACPAPSASRRGRRPRAARSEPSRPRPPLRPGPHALRPPPRRGRHASAARRRGRPSPHRMRASSRACGPRRARPRRP